MAEEEYEVTETSSQEGNPISIEDSERRLKKKKKKKLQRILKDEQGADESRPSGKKVESGIKKRRNKTLMETTIGEETRKDSNVDSVKKGKKKRERPLSVETAVAEENEEDNTGDSPREGSPIVESEEEQLLEAMSEDDGLGEENTEPDEDDGLSEDDGLGEENTESDDERVKNLRKKLKKRMLKEAASADNYGVCYLSRIPPRMDYRTIRTNLSNYGEIKRIYLAPAASTSQGQHTKEKRARKYNFQVFTEGWVEFADKRVAKKVANMLNGEPIGGKKRSQFYYDIWNIKYLSKFKWDDLTEETAYKRATREQRLALELAAAKRERDFVLDKFDRARAVTAIEERMKKKQNTQEGPQTESSVVQHTPKVKRKIPQRKSVPDRSEQSKPRLSENFLAGIFARS